MKWLEKLCSALNRLSPSAGALMALVLVFGIMVVALAVIAVVKVV